MSTQFEIPEWLFQAAPPTPPADPYRVEALVNRFIAGKQEALFTAPDAFYRSEAADAVDGEPAIAQRLQALRTAILGQAGDDGERATLGPRLDDQIAEAMDGIGRHVAAQRTALQRHGLAERQSLIRRAVELEPDDDDRIAGLAEAHAGAAQELARMDGVAADSPEEADRLAAARSQILRVAIEQRLGANRPDKAVTLYDRVKARLSPADRRALDLPIGAAADDAITDAWLKRETEAGGAGAPIDKRIQGDGTLSDMQRFILQAKIAARDSAEESRRAADLMELDDRWAEATAAIATQPARYRTGTFGRLAAAYDAAGAPEQAAETRRLALLEPLFLPFAQLGVAAQQRHLATFSGPERAMAEAIMRRQGDAFARDPYAAGTALYPEVGPPLPEEDVAGRLKQVRMIEARRGGEVGPSTHVGPNADAIAVNTNDVRIAEATHDDFRPIDPKRGIAPPTEPPANDLELEKAFEAWPGVKVTLPNGRGIEDSTSPTGYVMGPFDDLKSVAEAGKRERLNTMISPVETLRRYLGQGGVFDYQRRSYKYGKDGFTQLRQFRNIANINVGLFAQKLGLPLWVTLKIAGEYARRNSSNARLDQPFNLDPQTMEFIVVGYHLGDDGLID